MVWSFGIGAHQGLSVRWLEQEMVHFIETIKASISGVVIPFSQALLLTLSFLVSIQIKISLSLSTLSVTPSNTVSLFSLSLSFSSASVFHFFFGKIIVAAPSLKPQPPGWENGRLA